MAYTCTFKTCSSLGWFAHKHTTSIFTFRKAHFNVVETDYFCPERNYVSSQDLDFVCAVPSDGDITKAAAEQWCKYLPPPVTGSSISGDKVRDRDLEEDYQNTQNRELNVQAVQCAAGLLYNWTTRRCKDDDECIGAASLCPADEGSNRVDHDPEVRFECGCRRNFTPTGYPPATTTVWYLGKMVDALIEEAVNEQGVVSFYIVPVQLRPLGCVSILLAIRLHQLPLNPWLHLSRLPQSKKHVPILGVHV